MNFNLLDRVPKFDGFYSLDLKESFGLFKQVYFGTNAHPFVAGEAKDPQRTIPRALIIGTLILIGIYILANFAYVAALGTARMAASDRVAGEAL